MNSNLKVAKEHNNLKGLFFLFPAAFFVFVSIYTSIIVLPHYVLELGGTEFHSGLFNMLYFFSAVLFRIYFGPLADQRGRKLPLLIGVFVYATTPLLFFLVQDLWYLAPVYLYQAIGLASFLSSASSFIADLAPLNRRGTFLGAYRIVTILALLSGPSFAFLLINTYDFKTWFIFQFFMGLLSFMLIAMVKNPEIPVPGGSFGSLERVVSVLRDHKLQPIFLGIALIAVSYGALSTFVSIYTEQFTQISNPGIYFTYYGLAGIFATLSTGYIVDRFGAPLVAWPAVMIMGLGVAILFFLPSLPLIFYLSSFLAGAGMAGGLLAFITWLVNSSELEVRATALSVQESTIDSFMALGSFAVGVSSVLIGLPVSFAIIGLLVFALASKKIKRVKKNCHL
ncbi:putative MFS-type transporter [Candidatus Syntrophocurvum alkaliphilum]|uniref:Putative MFS-type transporter n=1 Tax=Candidatus Syntrophocurvum alkaliphilum TaxID=2293317 RepID=A0A6I6DEJ2_9FIRM|nr:MFS transporter [Candidatus Syntrophocurvum alkaliphilum]QGT98921.1 putative MFS-type transporter [Candidatus Syntrophocurvum alkaliphilum]